jgi:hypothetical protein
MGIGAGAVKGQIYETVKEEMIQGGVSQEQAKRVAMEAQSTFGKNLPSILVGSGLGALNARLGAELVITKVLSKGGLEASGSRVANIMANGFMEGAPELVQSAQQKFSENLALRQQGFDIPLTRGMYSEASLGGLSGLGVGMVAGGAEPRVARVDNEPSKQTREIQDSKRLSIYFDLDETLIHAQHVHSDSDILEQRTRITLQHPIADRTESYDSILRPHANTMLEFCRELGEVKLLTTANRQYALEHNNAFNLGFNPEQIIAREDYLSKTQLAYGSIYQVAKENTDASAFLIDNLHPDEDAPRLKRQYLGIKEDQYIQIREFSGKDPEIFSQELQSIFGKLEKHAMSLGRGAEGKSKGAIMETSSTIYANIGIEVGSNPVDVTKRLASKLHEIWVENYKRDNEEKRFKPINDPDFENLEIVSFKGKRFPKQDVLPSAQINETIEQIVEIRTRDGERIDTTAKNLYDCKLVENESSEGSGVLFQNIAQEPELLNSALMHKLNGGISEKYLETIGPELMEMSRKDFQDCREDIASLVHDVWVEENKAWAPQEQLVSYKDLPEFEKEKDRRVASVLMDAIQEVKTVEKLKGIEIESGFEPLSKSSPENIKKASDWLKQINHCGQELSQSPWYKEVSKTLDKVKESMSREVYDIAYREFEKSLTEALGPSVKVAPKPTGKKKVMDYDPGLSM